jgi:hypothetical protein
MLRNLTVRELTEPKHPVSGHLSSASISPGHGQMPGQPQMREQLLAYLLDDLNPAERSTVEAALADSPELQQELEKLRECLGCCESPAEPEPEPTQLASRTCHFVEHAIQKSKVLCNHSAGV